MRATTSLKLLFAAVFIMHVYVYAAIQHPLHVNFGPSQIQMSVKVGPNSFLKYEFCIDNQYPKLTVKDIMKNQVITKSGSVMRTGPHLSESLFPNSKITLLNGWEVEFQKQQLGTPFTLTFKITRNQSSFTSNLLGAQDLGDAEYGKETIKIERGTVSFKIGQKNGFIEPDILLQTVIPVLEDHSSPKLTPNALYKVMCGEYVYFIRIMAGNECTVLVLPKNSELLKDQGQVQDQDQGQGQDQDQGQGQGQNNALTSEALPLGLKAGLGALALGSLIYCIVKIRQRASYREGNSAPKVLHSKGSKPKELLPMKKASIKPKPGTHPGLQRR